MSRFDTKALQRVCLVLLATLPLSLAACDGPSTSDQPDGLEAPSSEPSRSVADGDTGTLSFDLRTDGGVTLNTFDYAITGPNFARAGSINVSNSNTVSTRIDGIPAGSGYSVTLSGSSVGTPVAQCSGSATFDIQVRTVKQVPVGIRCHLAEVVAPPTGPTAVPVPPFASWLCGLALLALGATYAPRRRRPEVAS